VEEGVELDVPDAEALGDSAARRGLARAGDTGDADAAHHAAETSALAE
jgi:hypothetical protein